MGFLQFSFVESVEATHPFYVIRAFGGVLFLAGVLIMAYNCWRTMRAASCGSRRPPMLRPGARPRRSGGVRRRAHGDVPRAAREDRDQRLPADRADPGDDLDRRHRRDRAACSRSRARSSRSTGVRPYTPLELAGRDIYLREGCYNCHSQMIRPFRDETERYGHYSLAAREHVRPPVPVGQQAHRPGPRAGRRQVRDEWQAAHLADPRSVVPESIMPPYAFLATTTCGSTTSADHLSTLRIVGVPYTRREIAQARADLAAQASPDARPRARCWRATRRPPRATSTASPGG